MLRDARSGEMDGIVLCSRVRGDAAHITQLCVRERRRGQGLGAALLESCLRGLERNGLRTVSLTVTSGNAGALHLYAREGFRLLHRFEAWVWDKGR